MPSCFSPRGKGSQHASKVGRKKHKGRPFAEPPPRSANIAAFKWKQKNSQLLLALAGRQGEAYDAGAVVTALRVLLNLFDEATDLKWDPENETMTGIEPVYRRAAHLTGVSMSFLKERFRHFLEHEEILVSDNAIRGRGSPNCNRTALRRLTPQHDAAIKAFVNYRNSSQGAGKVFTLSRARVKMFHAAMLTHDFIKQTHRSRSKKSWLT